MQVFSIPRFNCLFLPLLGGACMRALSPCAVYHPFQFEHILARCCAYKVLVVLFPAQVDPVIIITFILNYTLNLHKSFSVMTNIPKEK